MLVKKKIAGYVSYQKGTDSSGRTDSRPVMNYSNSYLVWKMIRISVAKHIICVLNCFAKKIKKY